MIVDHLHLHTAPLAPALIHALQHFGPVLAFGAASACVDFKIGVVGVCLSREKRPYLIIVGSVRQRFQGHDAFIDRSEEHTSELQSLMRISYAVFCLKKKTKTTKT